MGMAWTTPVDSVFNQKVFFYAFVGIIVGTTVFTLFSDSPIGNRDTLKKQDRGNDPENWSIDDLKRWLAQRDVHFETDELRNDLVRRVKGAMNASIKHEESRGGEGRTSDSSQQEEGIELKELPNYVNTESRI